MFSRIVVLVLCSLVLIRYFQHVQAQNNVPRFERSECEFNIPAGYEPECGYLIVPENRSNSDSPTISLGVAIYRSTSENPKPDPIVYLIGGPGGSALEYPFVSFNQRYRTFLEERDYIIFDQRGAMHSLPSLDCQNLFDVYYSWGRRSMSNEDLANVQADAIIDCHNELVASGIDIAAYNSAENAADVADLRVALGYDEWNVFGVSYGVRLALTLMRDHPEGIRSVVLDSVYAPQVDLFMEYGTNIAAAFDHVFESCANDAGCSEAYPDLENTFYDLVQRLNDEPYYLTAIHTVSDQEFSVYVSGELLVDTLFGLMYRRDDIPFIPYWIDDAANGGEELLTIAAQNFVDTPYGISEGLYYSISCSEETPFTNWDTAYANLEAMPEPIRNFTFLPAIQRICGAWTIQQPDAVENELVVSDLPTLVLDGDFDPITPPMWAEDTASGLSNSYYYVFPGTGHGVVRSTDCGLSVMLSFVDNPQQAPDVSCIDELGEPEWVVR
jgi:pimeloyl-ACP methyl ester carboxylesterase